MTKKFWWLLLSALLVWSCSHVHSLSNTSPRKDYIKANQRFQAVLTNCRKSDLPHEIWVGPEGQQFQVDSLVLRKDSSVVRPYGGTPRVMATADLNQINVDHCGWGSIKAVGIGAGVGALLGYLLAAWLTQDSAGNPGPHTCKDAEGTMWTAFIGAFIGTTAGLIGGRHEVEDIYYLGPVSAELPGASGELMTAFRRKSCNETAYKVYPAAKHSGSYFDTLATLTSP
jgi:hypothetical protein